MTYNFYLQKYPYTYWDEDSSSYITVAKSDVFDLESFFKCKYVRMDGISENGDVKNVYTEEYAETEELRIHSPKIVNHKNDEISLTVIFLAEGETEFDIQSNERALYEWLDGRKVEYHDSFRNRYLSLILLKKPEVIGEVLYGGSRYRQIKYTFKNIYGSSYASSKIE